MTGDVLPCFDASMMVLPDDAPCIITVPITLDIASNHGVIVASKMGVNDMTSSISLVENLLQKPRVSELVKNKAILNDGRTLLDTGIIAVRGNAWVELLALACSSQQSILDLIISRKEASFSKSNFLILILYAISFSQGLISIVNLVHLIFEIFEKLHIVALVMHD